MDHFGTVYSFVQSQAVAHGAHHLVIHQKQQPLATPCAISQAGVRRQMQEQVGLGMARVAFGVRRVREAAAKKDDA